MVRKLMLLIIRHWVMVLLGPGLVFVFEAAGYGWFAGRGFHSLSFWQNDLRMEGYLRMESGGSQRSGRTGVHFAPFICKNSSWIMKTVRRYFDMCIVTNK